MGKGRSSTRQFEYDRMLKQIRKKYKSLLVSYLSGYAKLSFMYVFLKTKAINFTETLDLAASFQSTTDFGRCCFTVQHQ